MTKLLLVDDSRAVRGIILRRLRRADLAVDEFLEAADGPEALERLAAHPDIALVLSDVRMPGMDGVELVRAIRARRSKERLPIVMLTFEDGCPRAATAVEHGANGVVRKPFTSETIRGELELYLRPAHGR